MELTKENKVHIDSLSYSELLNKWRFTTSDDPWIQGETGKYWGDRMAVKRAQHPNPSAVSKSLGWKK